MLPASAFAATLPARLDLQPPFPAVTAQAPQIEQVAPGIQYADYELWSDAGPISVHVVAADLSNPAVRVRTVLAHGVLTSAGETVTAMAQRTGAVAGINGDYFDIGQTNRPTNVVVRDGTLLLTPRDRYALVVLDSASAHFAQLVFKGSVLIGSEQFALDAINRRPAHAGAMTLLTPAFGPVPANRAMTLVRLTPTAGTPPLATYRVDGPALGGASAPAGYYLAAASDAGGNISLPAAGEAVSFTGDLTPIPLTTIADAVGGGPLILYNGAWYDDASGPGDAFDPRAPCSGAALESDGTLLLVEVDGRQTQRSIGLSRPELSALMRALGADDGIALDGGGSSTLAVQLLGESEPVLVSSPSDGAERSIADGIFLYNVAPVGPAIRLVASPETIRAMPGAQVALHVTAVDANDRALRITAPLEAVVEPSSLGSVVGDRFVARASGNGSIQLRSASLTGSVPLEVTSEPARLVLSPPDPDVDPHATLELHARAFDATGFRLTLPARLPWRASGGMIDTFGRFVAGEDAADVRLDLGGRAALVHVTVGSHEVPLEGFLSALHFLSFPAGGPGSATADPSCSECLRLTYSLASNERAAYAIVENPLPPGAVGLSFDVNGDAGSAELRVALRSGAGEQVLFSAVALDRSGLRHVTVRFPQGLAQPLRLIGFYAIAKHASQTEAGAVTIANVRVLVAGSR